MKRLAAALALLALPACATLSEDECLAGNWRAIGFEDGAQGQPPDRIGEHRRACERYGVSPNLEIWRLGYDEGLVRYCTRPNGFQVGVSGGTYHGVCRGPAEAEFLGAYRDGSVLHALRTDLDEARSDYDSVESDIRDTRSEREDLYEALREGGLSDEERRDIERDIEHLSERLGDLKSHRRHLSRDVSDIEREYDDFSAAMRAVYPEWSGY